MKRVIFIFLGVDVKKNKRPLKTAGSALLILVFALLCVGAVELAVCSYAAPELYSRITAPVRAGFQQLAEVNEAIWSKLITAADRAAEDASRRLQETAVRLQNAWESLRAQPAEDEGDLQLVDSEAVEPPPKSQASYAATSLISQHGREYLTGGAHEVIYFNQTDDRWAGEPYGSDHVGGYGCGPTVMAMVVATLADADTDPARMARLCVDLGYWASRHGSYRNIIPGISEEYGLSCTPLTPDETSESALLQSLSSGQLIVALVGPGHFTNSGHFIILRGITLDGSILVADPASRDRSLTAWEPSLILEELASNWDSGGPLWVISSNPL